MEKILTNEEKAKDMTRCLWYPQKCTEGDIQNMLIEMAAWKEQQIIEKACEWWENELTYPTMSAVEIDWLQTKIVAFRKEMEK